MHFLLVSCFVFIPFTSGLKASPGCNIPFEAHEEVYQEVYIETMNDLANGPVVREYIVQFPPGN